MHRIFSLAVRRQGGCRRAGRARRTDGQKMDLTQPLHRCRRLAGRGFAPGEVGVRLRVAYWLVSVAMVFCLCLSVERRAYAYVDPGSGLLMLQAAGAVFTGVLFTIRKRIKSLFGRSRPEAAKATDANRQG